MRKKDTASFLIAEMKRLDRRAFWGRPNIIALCIITSLIVLVVLASYYTFTSSQWLSNLFLGIATGLISGLVLYVMSNIKNTYKNRINRDALLLDSIISKTTQLRYILHPIPYVTIDEIGNPFDIVQDVIDDFHGLSRKTMKEYGQVARSLSDVMHQTHLDAKTLAKETYDILSKARFNSGDDYRIKARQSEYEESSIF